MEPAVLIGDFIIANKQIPGPSVYKNIRQFRFDGKVQTKRLKGIKTTKLAGTIFWFLISHTLLVGTRLIWI